MTISESTALSFFSSSESLVVTVVLAPTTLITGFFGMNTGGLPWTQLPYGTALTTGLLTGAIGLVLYLLRRGGML